MFGVGGLFAKSCDLFTSTATQHNNAAQKHSTAGTRMRPQVGTYVVVVTVI